MNFKDLSGNRIGGITVVKPIHKNGKPLEWECMCECGNVVFRSTTSLRDTKIKNVYTTCGCIHRNIDGRERSVVGQTIAELHVLSFDLPKRIYTCETANGDIIYCSTSELCSRIWRYNKNFDKNQERKNFLLSVGCNDEKEYSKKSRRIHHVLFLMKQRCYDKSSPVYHHYGGRGIKIYNEWLENSKSFVIWSLQNGYKENLEIDRIDNNDGYYPENCRWTDKLTNANNKRNNKYIEFKNRTQTLAQWCRELEIDYKKTHYLIKYKNYSLQECIEHFQNKS